MTASLAEGGMRIEEDRRIDWIDAAKGLGIVLVVVGHIVSVPGLLGYLDVLRVPMFFMLAGAVSRARPHGEAARRGARGLIVPYAAHMLLVAALFPIEPLAMLWGGPLLGGPFSAFWFVTALFAALLVRNAIDLATASGGTSPWVLPVAGGTICACLAWVLPPALPLGLAAAPMAVPFLLLGAAYRRAWSERRSMVWTAAAWGIVTAYAQFILGGSADFFHVDMRGGEYGPLYLGLLVSASAGILLLGAVRAATDYLPNLCRPLVAIGRFSLCILLLHQPVHFAVAGAFDLPDIWVVAAALLVPYAFALVARRWGTTRAVFLGAA